LELQGKEGTDFVAEIVDREEKGGYHRNIRAVSDTEPFDVFEISVKGAC